MPDPLTIIDPPATKRAFCAQPFRRIKVGPTGDVSSCCWQGHDALGSLLRRTLEEVWRGDDARDVRRAMMAGELHGTCGRGCNYLYTPREMRDVPWTGWPTIIEIDPPNTACNTACLMCPRSSADFRPDGDRLDEVLPKLRPLMAHARILHVQGLAEVHWRGTLHRILDGLGYDEHARRIEVATFTNGSTLDAETRARFFGRCPLSATWFSLDAATPDTFRTIRKLDLGVVLGHLKAYAAERVRPGHWLGMNNNINLLNVGECGGMVELAADSGAEIVTFNVTEPASTAIAGLTLYDEANARNPAVVRRFRMAHREAVARADALGVPVRFYKPLDLGLGGGEPLPLTGAFSPRGSLV